LHARVLRLGGGRQRLSITRRHRRRDGSLPDANLSFAMQPARADASACLRRPALIITAKGARAGRCARTPLQAVALTGANAAAQAPGIAPGKRTGAVGTSRRARLHARPLEWKRAVLTGIPLLPVPGLGRQFRWQQRRRGKGDDDAEHQPLSAMPPHRHNAPSTQHQKLKSRTRATNDVLLCAGWISWPRAVCSQSVGRKPVTDSACVGEF
jgi:hypothetical protein